MCRRCHTSRAQRSAELREGAVDQEGPHRANAVNIWTDGRHSPNAHTARHVWLSAIVTLQLVGCSAPGVSPTAPTGGAPARASLDLFCPASVLTFESSVCSGAARTSTDQTVLLWAPGAGTWSAAPPGVLEVDNSGRVTGRAGGVATVSVSYEGMTALRRSSSRPRTGFASEAVAPRAVRHPVQPLGWNYKATTR